jgi:hypothetical protein
MLPKRERTGAEIRAWNGSAAMCMFIYRQSAAPADAKRLMALLNGKRKKRG